MGGGGDDDGPNEDMYKLMKMIVSREFYPVIVFSFSRRECEEHPKALKKLDFTTDDEKVQIRHIFDNALLCMPEEDRELKAVLQILPLLERGIGIHHSGLLPIIKELVEILFGESLVKCLFATETFAMGLNMPARTVVFTAVKKFDGQEMRVLVRAGGDEVPGVFFSPTFPRRRNNGGENKKMSSRMRAFFYPFFSRFLLCFFPFASLFNNCVVIR